MLLKYFLGIISTSNNGHSDCQSLPSFVKLGRSSGLVNFVHQVYIEVVNLGIGEYKSGFVYVKCSQFHAFNVLYEDSYS